MKITRQTETELEVKDSMLLPEGRARVPPRGTSTPVACTHRRDAPSYVPS
jgi:hypothetical protein